MAQGKAASGGAGGGAGAIPPPMTRVLRIAAAVGNNIVEERYVRQKRAVTIGQAPTGNLLSIPLPELPRSFTLFDHVDGGWALCFTDDMDGRVSLSGHVIKLGDLKARATARAGGVYVVALPDKSHGKVVVGSVTFLFQFVSAPAAQPRVQLPRSVKGTFGDDVDHFMAAVLAASFLLHFGLLVLLRVIDFPDKPDIDRIPDRFVSLVVPERPPPVTEEVAEVGTIQAPPKKPEGGGTGGGAGGGRRSGGDGKPVDEGRPDAEALAAAARNVGIARILGAATEGEGSALSDLLKGGDPGGDADKVFSEIGGVGVASAGSNIGLQSGRGGGTGRLADLSGLRGATGPSGGGGTGNKAEGAAPRGRVGTEGPPAVDGELDAGVVAAEIRRRLSAVKLCYERELKRNPGLGGKIVVRFTISTVGRVSSVEIESTSVKDPAVEGCIVNAIQSWRFPAPSGGSVEVAYPFVLTPAK